MRKKSTPKPKLVQATGPTSDERKRAFELCLERGYELVNKDDPFGYVIVRRTDKSFVSMVHQDNYEAALLKLA